MARKYFYSEDSYNDFMYKSNGTGHGQDGKSGLYEVEYEPKWKKNED